MRLITLAAYIALALNTTIAVSLPESRSLDVHQHKYGREFGSELLAPEHALEKRKGGGGKGGGSGGSGGKTGGSSGSGSSSGGSGAPRSYGSGGAFYGGGATTPYRSGSKTPKGLIAGTALGVGAAALIFPGIWLYSVYPYYYSNPYRFYNRTATNSSNPNGVNQTLPVTCLCEQYQNCGCDENTDSTYIDAIVGNGSYSALNKTLATVSQVNGTTTSLVLNGTLSNDTTAPGQSGAMRASSLSLYSGYWLTGLIAVYAVVFL